MHVTLSRWFNMAMIALWALLLWALLQTTRPFPTTEVIAGALLGLVAGLLQLQAISKAPEVFAAALEAKGVRRAFMTARPGRFSVYLKWVATAGLLVWAMAFAPDMFLGAWLSGVCAFGVAREMAAFPGALRLAGLGRANTGRVR